ncbi:MAG: hypothetical protein A4E53_02063 [Pelotomaculum sp. PtaB.Bin104]|nr:MAG: hypothetical protein A4E53_02063 [Pelotomaculum sp. PtaB.Bin104]
MPKKREKVRANIERFKGMDRRNSYGKPDLTPYNAVRVIKGKTIVYK